MIHNNRLLTYVYLTNLEACLIPNHILFGCTLNQVSDHNASITCEFIDLSAYSNRVNKIINGFWDCFEERIYGEMAYYILDVICHNLVEQEASFILIFNIVSDA